MPFINTKYSGEITPAQEDDKVRARQRRVRYRKDRKLAYGRL